MSLMASLAAGQAPSNAGSASGPPPDTQQQTGQQQDMQWQDNQQQDAGSTKQVGAGESQDIDVVSAVTAPRTLDQPGVKELGGRGRLFSDRFDWLHWGPIGVRSADVFYSSLTNDGNPSAHFSTTTFQTNIAYNQRFQHSRLIWQYSPRILVANGDVSKELSNQDSTFDVMFAPTARFAVGISNWFSFYGRDNTVSDRTLERNSFSGAIANPFLNSGRQTLLNSIAVPLSYNVSARTSISVAPFFSYGRVSESSDPTLVVPGEHSVLSMFQYGARTQVNHIFSVNQSMGVYYTYQISDQREIDDTTYFQSFGATFARRLGRTLALNGEFGGSRSRESHLSSWTGVGLLTLTKSFHHSALQGTAGRDASFSGLLGNGYSDYAWLNYSRQLGRRISLAGGFGYLSGPSRGHSTTGKYANGNISYSLSRNVSWFFTYQRFWQQSVGAQFGGNQAQYQVGLRWTPSRRNGD